MNEIPTEQKTLRHVDVAIALVFDRDRRRILICKRKAGALLGGYWEFPGGKCEPGEPPAQCASREVKEETALAVRLLHALPPIEHDYPYARVRLHPFLCEWIAGELQPLEVAEARWIEPAALREYRFPEANTALVDVAAGGFAALAKTSLPSPPV